MHEDRESHLHACQRGEDTEPESKVRNPARVRIEIITGISITSNIFEIRLWIPNLDLSEISNLAGISKELVYKLQIDLKFRERNSEHISSKPVRRTANKLKLMKMIMKYRKHLRTLR